MLVFIRCIKGSDTSDASFFLPFFSDKGSFFEKGIVSRMRIY